MNVSSSSLLPEQQLFYHTHYEVLNPYTGVVSQDFSILNQAKVVLIAEKHGQLTLMQSQAAIIRSYMLQSTCLLLEGLAPNVNVESDRLVFLREMPLGLKVKGSDLRAFKDKEAFIEGENLYYEQAAASQNVDKKIEIRIRKVAAVINEGLTSGEISIKNGELVATQRRFAEIKKAIDDTKEIHEATQVVKSLHERREASPQFTQYFDASRVVLFESNMVLLEEIIKACKSFDRVFAIWGFLHFIGDVEFYEKLRKKGINIVLLVPKKEYIKNEDSFDAKLVIRQRRSISVTSTINFPRIFIPFFDPRISDRLNVETTPKDEVIYTPERLVSIAQSSEYVTFPAHTIIHFSGVEYKATSELYDLLQRQSQQSTAKLISVLNRYLFLTGVWIDAINYGASRPEIDLTVLNNTICLTFNSPSPFYMHFNITKCAIDAPYFFHALQKEPDNMFRLYKGHAIRFTELTHDDLINDEALETILGHYAPPRTKVIIEGDYTFQGSTYIEVRAEDDVVFKIEQVAGQLSNKRNR